MHGLRYVDVLMPSMAVAHITQVVEPCTGMHISLRCGDAFNGGCACKASVGVKRLWNGPKWKSHEDFDVNFKF